MKSRFAGVFFLLWVFPMALFGEPLTPKNVLCSIFPIYAVAQEIASGTGVQLSMLLPATLGCPHHYSLSPGDLQKVQKADLILLNGGDFEPFIPALAREFPGIRQVACASGSALLPSRVEPGKANPHLFVTIPGIRTMAGIIADELQQCLPDKKELIARNSQTFYTSLESGSQDWEETRKLVASLPVIITHESLEYVASALQLRVAARLAFDVEEGREPSAGEMLSLIKTAKEEKPLAIIVDDQHPDSAAQTLSNETGIPIVKWNTCISGQLPISGDFFLRTARSNLALLRQVLTASATPGLRR